MFEPSKICTKCHIEKPMTNEYFAINKRQSSGFHPSCKECKRQKDKIDYATNPNPRLIQAKIWHKNNRERKRLYDRAYREQNFERIAAKKKADFEIYKAKNQLKVRAMSAANAHKRRTLLTNQIAAKDLISLTNRFGNRCAYCRTVFSVENKLEFDHVVPLSRGGRHSIGNLLPACLLCNRNKSYKFVMEWRLRKFVPLPRNKK